MRTNLLLLAVLAAAAPVWAQTYGGSIDVSDCVIIRGWAWDANAPNSPVNLDIYRGSTLLATIPADRYRPDLPGAGIGNGYHGFSYPTPAGLKTGLAETVYVRFAGTMLDVPGSPRTIACQFNPPGFRDALTAIDATVWQQNGSVTAGPTGLTSPSTTGGALIHKTWAGSEYEARMTLNLGSVAGGAYTIFLRASPDALPKAAGAGTYYAVAVDDTPIVGLPGLMKLDVYKRVNGVLTTLGTTRAPRFYNVEVRSVIRADGTIIVVVNGKNYLTVTDTAIPSGAPGVGAYSTPVGSSIMQVEIASLDTTVPAAPASVIASAYADRVDLQWTGSADGTGVEYEIYRNGAMVTAVPEAEYADRGLAASTTYAYGIRACDYHYNCSATTTVNVTTLAANTVEPRRIGVRPDGVYWGTGGEQIDMRSGNLNYSIPLLKAIGRGTWSVPFNLSYNSQAWKQDSGGTWRLGQDVGYGFGWKLMAGSLTPYWSSWYTIDHYIFTDATGAEYKLDVNTYGTWTSKEPLYVEYDSGAKRLYFPDGSFWQMGSIASGLENDAGTLYPTLMQDTNGNQVLVRYQTGNGALLINSSARIAEIEDVRALGFVGQRWTYSFSWAGTPLPHITGITNKISTSENYDFTTGVMTLASPWGAPYGSTYQLLSLTRRGLALTHSFAHNSSGELTQVALPYGGTVRWDYRTFTYPNGRALRELQNRYLTSTPGQGESQYQIAWDDNPAGAFHTSSALRDPSGDGRAWGFVTNNPQLDGLPSWAEERPTDWSIAVRKRNFSYGQDSAGRNYVSGVETVLDPGAASEIRSKTEQTVDPHGNVTQSKVYDYGQLTTPARTYTHTYRTDSAYYGRHMWNRLVSSTVTDGANTVTLVTNTYDGATLTDRPGLLNHDPLYGTSYVFRGNVTKAVSPGKTLNMKYDIGGNVVSADDGYGHTVANTFSTSTQYAAPDKVSPSNDNLATSYTYSPFLAPTSITAPGAAASVEYDYYGLPKKSTSPYGAVTTYVYDNPNRLVTATTGTRIERTTVDGLGRTVKTETGDASGMQSVVETEYGPCACSPLGRVKRVSRPYKPGETVYWTEYAYDTLGRTPIVYLPGGAGRVVYDFLGNTATITDPAGKWKKYTTDAMGNLKQVTEPAPEGGTHETYYTYNLLGQMTQVRMPRATGTQTRTFNYDLATGRLTNATNPENGTVSYVYNSDGTLLRKTDAKGQKVEFSYDGYQRITQKRKYNSGGSEDTCSRVDYRWDQDGSTVYWGRLVWVQWGAVTGCTGGLFKESYAYGPGGLLASKTLKISKDTLGSQIGEATMTYFHTDQGQLSGMAFPSYWNWETLSTGYSGWKLHSGAYYYYTMDTLGRPVKLTRMSDGVIWADAVSYGAAGEIKSIRYRGPRYWGADVPYYLWYTETRTYNALGQLTRMQALGDARDPVYGVPPGPPTDYEYRYGAANDGRITQRKDWISGEEVNYQYDTLGRLSLAETTGPEWGMRFSYDGFGNLTGETATKGTGFTTTYNHDANNRLIGGYAYDANGNLTSMPALTLTYDIENRLSKAVHTTNGTEQYVYNPWNERVWWKPANGYETIYLYGPDGQLAVEQRVEIDTSAVLRLTTQQQELRLGGKLLRSGDGEVIEDRVGTANAKNYYPYGELKAGATARQFATYRRDPSGLDYAINRYYASQVGRFTTPDPSGGADFGVPQSWNRYAYVIGDPVNLRDQDGLRYRLGDGIMLGDAVGFGMGFGSFTLPDSGSTYLYPVFGLFPGGGNTPGGHGGGGNRRERIPGDQRARDLLGDPKCAKAVRAKSAYDAVTKYDQIQFSSSDLGRVRIDADGNYDMPALAQQVGKNVVINKQVEWQNPNGTVGITADGKPAPAYVLDAIKDVLGASSFTASDYQAMVILHEMAHYFGAPQESKGDWSFTKKILTDCLPEVFK